MAANSGIGPPGYASELNNAADDMEAGVNNYAQQVQYNNWLMGQQNQRQLAAMDADIQGNYGQQDIMRREQARREADTARKYAYLNQQSNNALAGQRSLMQGMQGMFGGGQSLLGGLLGGGHSQTPTTTMYNATGTPFGGTSYKANTGGLLSGLIKGGGAF